MYVCPVTNQNTKPMNTQITLQNGTIVYISGSTIAMRGNRYPITLASQHPITGVWRVNMDNVGFRLRERADMQAAIEALAGAPVEYYTNAPKIQRTPEEQAAFEARQRRTATINFRKRFSADAARYDRNHGAENWHAEGNTTIGFTCYFR